MELTISLKDSDIRKIIAEHVRTRHGAAVDPDEINFYFTPENEDAEQSAYLEATVRGTTP